jgi:hemerythrin-like domain-containing protein
VENNPYDVLAREHRLIERGLVMLGHICDEIRRTKSLDTQSAALIVRFLRDFADRTHHLKEEKILFPSIEAKSFFPGCGLISEHKEGRLRVRGMVKAVERSSVGDAEGARIFVRKARSYINLLRGHIAKEDDCLARVTAATFTTGEGERLIREFEEMERREIGERVFEQFTAIIETLEAKYGADHAPDAIATIDGPSDSAKS